MGTGTDRIEHTFVSSTGRYGAMGAILYGVIPDLEPMLAGHGYPAGALDGWAVEPKLDGWRVRGRDRPPAPVIPS